MRGEPLQSPCGYIRLANFSINRILGKILPSWKAYTLGVPLQPAYHYSLVIDIDLISFPSFVASTLTTRRFYKTPLAAAVRLLSGITVIVLLSMILRYQYDQRDGPELWRSYKKKTSAILFPASCFLDPNFHVFQRHNSTDSPETKLAILTA